MKIIKAHAQDAQRAYQIRQQAIWHHCRQHYDHQLLQGWTEGEMTPEFITDVEQNYYLVNLANQVIATGMINLSTGKIDAIFVDPAFMRQGVASSMLKFLQTQAIKAGLVQVSLEATLNAAEFYRRHGFIGEHISQYHSPRGLTLACVPMHKTLI